MQRYIHIVSFVALGMASACSGCDNPLDQDFDGIFGHLDCFPDRAPTDGEPSHDINNQDCNCPVDSRVVGKTACHMIIDCRFFVDTDADGFGDDTSSLQDCSDPLESDTVFFVRQGGDCDDNNRLVYQGADESCDGFDNNCDGQIDEDHLLVFFPDNDGDGFGKKDSQPVFVPECSENLSDYNEGPWSDNSDDCNDRNENIYPGALEICLDNKDQDCDGLEDDDESLDQIDPETLTRCFFDSDGDGFGSSEFVEACLCPSGTVIVSGDVDDDYKLSYPNAPEICDNIDNDGDSFVDEDADCIIFDDDEDGFSDLAGDCNDSNPDVNPDAVEVCDGFVDHNCDGTVDENCPRFDDDGDGYCETPPCIGSVNIFIVLMSFPDCDDTNFSISPGQQDADCDGVDNNCNMIVDDACACESGSTTNCFVDGKVGECALGEATCLPNGSGYGICVQIAVSEQETCDDGRDQDCDGFVDNGCACEDGEVRPCLTGLPGVCSHGSTTCLPDRTGFGECQQQLSSVLEDCGDDQDNDCDGEVDEGCECIPGSVVSCVAAELGECARGEATCLFNGTGFGECLPAVDAADEVCSNGRDDDCDGLVDEGCVCTPNEVASCITGELGECSEGETTCLSDGTGFGPCQITTTPETEVCSNGRDEDCNGVPDNGCACTSGQVLSCSNGLSGACGFGQTTCSDDGEGFGFCKQTTYAQDEICDDGVDNDCDGFVDEVCVCTPGTVIVCNTGFRGACAFGESACKSDGTGFGVCVQIVFPEMVEICMDGIDSDCNGIIDDGCITLDAGSRDSVVDAGQDVGQDSGVADASQVDVEDAGPVEQDSGIESEAGFDAGEADTGQIEQDSGIADSGLVEQDSSVDAGGCPPNSEYDPNTGPWAEQDRDGDDILNSFDVVNVLDRNCDDINETICVLVSQIYISPWSDGQPGIRQGAGFGGFDSVNLVNLDLISFALGAPFAPSTREWCYNFTNEPAGSFKYRYISLLSNDEVEVLETGDPCDEWKIPEFNVFCTNSNDQFCGFEALDDSCQAIGSVIEANWDPTTGLSAVTTD